MTDLLTIPDRLDAIAGELAEYADEIRQAVPPKCDRYAPILEAYNRLGGASAEVQRANRTLRRAIKEV